MLDAVIPDGGGVEFGANVVPGHLGLVLCDADEKQGQPAEENVSPDAILKTVIDRPEVDGVFEIPIQTLDAPQLLVAEGDVFGRHLVVGGADEKLAVISLFGFDTGLVQTEFACLGLADVTAKGGMAAKRTRRPGVGLSLELVERLETPLDLGDDVHALLLVPFGLSRVVDNDITPGSRALLADDHLFDLKTLFELLVG